MGKFIKSIVAGILALSMATWGAPVWATVDVFETIGASVTIPGSATMTVELLDTVTGAIIGTSDLTYTYSGVTLASPWLLANECIEVTYSSNYAWAIRIVTDNYEVVESELTAAAATATDINGDGSIDILDYVAPSWNAAHTERYYSGMLSVDDIDAVIAGQLTVDTADDIVPADDQDPSKRIVWVWLASTEHDYTGLTANLATSSIVSSGSGSMYEDDNVGYCWDFTDADSWGYIGDKSDDGFSEEIFTGTTDELTYPIVATGFPGTNGSLVPFTFDSAQVDSDGDTYTDMVDLSSDDGDIVIYIAGRFGNTNWGDTSNPVPYLLPGGDYETSLYVELIHE